MNTASRGRALEHEVRELFRQAGWSVVRGAGSKEELDVDCEPMIWLYESNPRPGTYSVLGGYPVQIENAP